MPGAGLTRDVPGSSSFLVKMPAAPARVDDPAAVPTPAYVQAAVPAPADIPAADGDHGAAVHHAAGRPRTGEI